MREVVVLDCKIGLIAIHDFCEVESFKIDKSEFQNMDDRLPVGTIEQVSVGTSLK